MKPIIDISEHEGNIDFAELAKHCAGIILRAGYGLQKDAKFEEYYTEAKAAGLPIGAYHWPIDQRSTGAQVDAFAGWINSKVFELGIYIDIEQPNISGHTQSKSLIDAYLSQLRGRVGVKPVIYASAESWKIVMGADTPFYTEYPLWVAHYGAKRPALPLGAKEWMFWQYTDEGKIAGASAALDLNHYNTALMAEIESVGVKADELKKPAGKIITTNTTERLAVRLYPVSGHIVRWLDPSSVLDYFEFKAGWYRVGFNEWISGEWAKVKETYTQLEPPIEPQPEPAPEGVLFEGIVETTYDWLPIRETPSMNAKEVGRLSPGAHIRVLEANKDRWYRIADGQWVYGQRVRSLVEPLKTLAYPMEKKYRISQIFGVNSGTYGSSRGHNGVDFACYEGTKLIAAADGFVETLELTTTYGYGRHMRIRVQGGVLIYGHMKEIFAKLGQKVKKGEVIGFSDGAVGMPYAGFSTGNHLHFEYRLDAEPKPLKPGNWTYWSIDPLPLLEDPKA